MADPAMHHTRLYTFPSNVSISCSVSTDQHSLLTISISYHSFTSKLAQKKFKTPAKSSHSPRVSHPSLYCFLSLAIALTDRPLLALPKHAISPHERYEFSHTISPQLFSS